MVSVSVIDWLKPPEESVRDHRTPPAGSRREEAAGAAEARPVGTKAAIAQAKDRANLRHPEFIMARS
jgi:hypothetical protein